MLITRGMGISNSGGGSGENVYVPVSDPLITTNILGSTNMILTSNNPSLNPIKSNVNYHSHTINFLLDTGASNHFINDKSLFLNFTADKSTIT